MKRLILLMLAAAYGFAQTPAPERWRIASLAVEGNHNYTAQQVLGVAGLKVGQMAGKIEFDAARDRLLATGVFETVGYKSEPVKGGTGNAATFQVTESPVVYPVRFRELGVPDRDIESLLRARDPLFSMTNLPANQPVLARYADWIREYLSSKGIDEKIAGVVTLSGPEQFVIVFRPARNPPSVAEVTFEGNEAIAQDVLRDAMVRGGIGALYTEEDFRVILETVIRPLYESCGRMRVGFPKIRTEPVSDVQGVHVFVTVDEGKVYSLGKVAIAGPSPVDTRHLLEDGAFKTGVTANFDDVKAGLERIRKTVRGDGYLDVKVTMDRKIDDAKMTVDVAIHIDAGPLYKMGKLHIAGLGLEGEAEMIRIWTLKEGQPFNPNYPDHFLDRVREDGMFDHLGKTTAEVKIDDKGHTADVTLHFAGEDPKPGKPGRRGGG